MQTGTGLGLAIVNSIVRSRSVDGKIDVWSAEGVGTEIKITFTAEKVEDDEYVDRDAELVKIYDSLRRPSISLVGFDAAHPGGKLLRSVIASYLEDHWGLAVVEDCDSGDIAIVNEDPSYVIEAAKSKGQRRPYIILSSLRGDPTLMNVINEYERVGGFCRVVFKPVGPHRLYSVLKLCLHALHIAQARSSSFADKTLSQTTLQDYALDDNDPLVAISSLARRYSEETTHARPLSHKRPLLGPRAATAHPLTSWSDLLEATQQTETEEPAKIPDSPLTHSPSSPTVSVGSGGSLLRSSIGSLRPTASIRVLVVEDNTILRSLL